MRWMLWGRQQGKTYQTIKWFMEDPEHRIIITADEQMADVVRRMIMEQVPYEDRRMPEDARRWKKLLERQVVGAVTWLRKSKELTYTFAHGEMKRPQVAIDNLELTLPALLNANVTVVTATGVNESPIGLVVDPRRAEIQEWWNSDV